MGSNQEIVFINNPVVLLDEVTRILDHGQMVRDSLAGSVKPATATFDNLIAPLQDATNLTASHLGPITILARVAADPALREAARQAELMIAAAQSTALMRTDIAALVAAVYGESRPNQSPFQGQRTSGEDDYLVAYMHGRYLRSGANIRETDVRERYTVAQQRLDKLLADARKTLTEDSGGVWFELDDLAGVPEKTLHSMKRQPQEEHENEEGTRRMLLRAELRKNHLAPVMRSARNEETRKKLYQAKETRFPANVGRLAEIVRLRHEIALLLGFRSHAELKMENMMHRSVADVQRVLEQTRDGLRSFAREEIAVMMRLKRGDDACAAELFSWDWAFYNQSLRRQHYAVDAQYASEFFEVTHTFEQMLRVFEALFGLRFKEAEGSSSTWHQDVTVYELWDASSEKEDKQLGKLYVDLFSREGKYDGASHVVLSPVRHVLSRCERTYPHLQCYLVLEVHRKRRKSASPILSVDLQLRKTASPKANLAPTPRASDYVPRTRPRNPLPHLPVKVRHPILTRLRRGPKPHARELHLGARCPDIHQQALQPPKRPLPRSLARRYRLRQREDGGDAAAVASSARPGAENCRD